MLLRLAQVPDVRRVDLHRGVHERRVHPHAELRVVRGVLRARRVPAAVLLRHAVHARVDVAQALGRLVRLLGRAEDDARGEVERPVEAAPRVLAVVRVLRDARADERMGDLHDDRGASSEEKDALPVHPPGDALGAEQARVAHGGGCYRRVPGTIAHMTWGFIWMVVVLEDPDRRAPVARWWAVHAEPEPAGPTAGRRRRRSRPLAAAAQAAPAAPRRPRRAGAAAAGARPRRARRSDSVRPE